MAVGILALQGDFYDHHAMFEGLGVEAVLVKTPLDLEMISGIVIPGGESTTMSMLLESSGLYGPLGQMLKEGFPAFGTCAGMILLSGSIVDGRADQRTFAAIDITVRRNGFGRQVASFETDIAVSGIGGGPMRAVFIRAPVVEAVADGVEVLASVTYEFKGSPGRNVPVICRQDKVFVTSFHPEIVGDSRLHELFLEHL